MYDCIVIGAGPAGLMSAITASKKGRVLLLEKNSKAGVKLLLTGGGRCNVTNLKNVNEFLVEVDYNNKYLYSALSKFGPYEIVDYFINRGVFLKEENDNRMFPKSNKAIDILNALLSDLNNVEVKYDEAVNKLECDDLNTVITTKNVYKAKCVVIATGGVSYKQTGSSGDHLEFAKGLKQPIKSVFPAEVGVILKEKNDLAGTAIDFVNVYFDDKRTSGNLMFTHNGLSGESIMKMSEHIYKGNNKFIEIDFFPNLSDNELLNSLESWNRDKELVSWLNNYFTKRFSTYLIDNYFVNRKVKQMTKNDKTLLIKKLRKFAYEVDNVVSIDRAYVTGGGIDLDFINSSTMESKINKGIYFVGEALDIHGPIGGYNIILALSTGHLAGSSISEKIEF